MKTFTMLGPRRIPCYPGKIAHGTAAAAHIRVKTAAGTARLRT